MTAKPSQQKKNRAAKSNLGRGGVRNSLQGPCVRKEDPRPSDDVTEAAEPFREIDGGQEGQDSPEIHPEDGCTHTRKRKRRMANCLRQRAGKRAINSWNLSGLRSGERGYGEGEI